MEEKRLAEERQLQLEFDLRQAQKLEALGTFAAGVSHDFGNLTSAVLSYSRLERDLRQPLGYTARFIRPVLPAGIYLEGPRLSDLPIYVMADEAQIQQALMNLIFNACNAMPEGGLITLALDTDANGSTANIEVRDMGVGTSEEVRRRVFEPFFTTKPRGQGTGLGLSVSHGIIADHGGVITVESEIGKGSMTLILTLCYSSFVRISSSSVFTLDNLFYPV